MLRVIMTLVGYSHCSIQVLQEGSIVVSRLRGCILRRTHLKAYYITTQREGSHKCSLAFWNIQRYDTLQPAISQDLPGQQKL